MKNNEFRNADFLNDEEKMKDFKVLSKEEFLKSYSYLTEEEYDNTYNKYYTMTNTFHWVPIEEGLPEEDKNVLFSSYTIKDKIRELFGTLNNCKQRLTELKEEVGDPIGTSNMVTEDDHLIYDIETHLENLEEYAEMSEEYSEFLESLNHISATQLKRIVDNYEVLVNHYKEYFPWRNGVTTVEDFKEDLKPLSTFVDKITTNKRCPKCGELLLKSDLPQYNYVCPLCDENFYGCEVK